ncbi:tetratricopeptide repeat-containing sensor histidine kinase [Nafulsella turpanensis]|uniref:tetratricopeptide repeat-containing sensor histidine kinase n=1 Tax=Nafulsella turpanensis TaxID=1265690 RepID=UPI00034998E1|nr:tetratricopeptide repeat protein [Nafulsella turpanensis]
MLLLSGFSVSAQPSLAKVDSLEAALELSGRTERFRLLEEIIPIYLRSKPELALQKSREAYALARDSGNPRQLAIAGNYVGNSVRHLISNYDSALQHCFEALSVSQQHQLLPEQVSILNTIGDIYHEVGNSYKAIEYFMQAQILAERLQLKGPAADGFIQIGRVYASIGNESKAVDYYGKALTLSRQQHYQKGIADSQFRLALIYQAKGNLQQALERHQKAITIRKNIADKEGIGESKLSLGRLYLQQGQHAEARISMNESLQIFREIQFPDGQAQALNNLGLLSIAQQQYEEALPLLESALVIGEIRNDKKIIRDSYENLYACYAALKDYEKALQYKDLFVAISDFIYGEESERRMAELQTRFEIAEKEREIDALKKDKQLRELAMQKQTNFRDFLITIVLLLITILGLIVFLYRNNRKNTQVLRYTNSTIHQQNTELQELNATKDKFFSIISHDLKGPLNSLTAFSGMLIKHTDALTKEEIQSLAKDLDKSLKNLLSLLENLLEWSRSQTGIMELKPTNLKLRSLVRSNIDLLQKMADNKNISIITNVPEHLQAFAGENQMNTVLRNLISNALKFTKAGGLVTISAKEWKDVIEVVVEDTGVGISPEALQKLFKIEYKHSSPGTANEKGTGLGLMLCKEFIQQNGGELQVESKEGKGSTFRFTVPKAEVVLETV